MSHTLLILKIYTTFKDVQMMLKIFFDISTSFRFLKISVECSVHLCSCPCPSSRILKSLRTNYPTGPRTRLKFLGLQGFRGEDILATILVAKSPDLTSQFGGVKSLQKKSRWSNGVKYIGKINAMGEYPIIDELGLSR